MRLIDAEYLIDCIDTVQEMALAIGGKLEAIEPVNEGFISLVNSQPTIEAEPVRHGNWIKYYETDNGRCLRCSKCLMVFWVGDGREGNYCPNCGAKMDEVEE